MKTFSEYINESKAKKMSVKVKKEFEDIMSNNKNMYKDDGWYIKSEYLGNGVQLKKYFEYKGDDNDTLWLKKDSEIEIVAIDHGDIVGRKTINLNSMNNKELLSFLSKYTRN